MYTFSFDPPTQNSYIAMYNIWLYGIIDTLLSQGRIHHILWLYTISVFALSMAALPFNHPQFEFICSLIEMFATASFIYL